MHALTLPRLEAHLWLAWTQRCCTPANLERYAALLDPSERERLQRLRFEHLRHEYLLTRALCRHALSHYVDVTPGAWRFRANAHGRPQVAAPSSVPTPDFNLSNARSLVACVVAWDREIGVDVEPLDRIADMHQLAASHFAPREYDALRALPAERQARRFFELWTLKESYIKARGLGLAIPLDHFAFDLDVNPLRFHTDPRLGDDAASWQFQSIEIENHRVAIALRRGHGGDLSVRVFETVPLDRMSELDVSRSS